MKKTLSLLLVFTLLLSACALKSTSPEEVEVAEPEASEMEVQSVAPETADEGLAIPLSAGTATMLISPATSTVNVGQTFDVLVEGPSKTDPKKQTGRTRHNRIAVFPCDHDLTAQVVPVTIKDTTSLTLFGEML